MTFKVRKPVSKSLGIWTFLLFFILKGAFPKPAYAFLSSLDACAAQPECAAAISSEVAPAVATPTASGVATTITSTTAAGATTASEAAAGVTVVGDMRLSGIAAYYLWSRGVNGQAQEIARQRYCAAYSNDEVCSSTSISYVQGYGYRAGCLPPVFVSIQIPFGQEGNIISQADSYCGPGGVLAYYRNGGRFNDTLFDGSFSIFSTSNPPLPWKDWPQEKRSTAVGLLTASDWLGLINSMPVGGRLIPGDTVNAPSGIIIPGQEEDDPNTPADERLLRKEPGFFTDPGLPNRDFDRDGTPDTSDPEPQNPNVPIASSEPPPPEESVPGVDVPFSAPDPDQPPNEAVTDKARSMNNIPDGKDCSEIAEDLLEAAGNVGEIIEVLPAQGQYLNLYEYGKKVEGFLYHQVYTDGNYVYDPRLSPDPVKRDEWEGMIRGLNPGATFQSISNQ